VRLKLPALDAQNFSVQELLRDMPETVLIHLENKLALGEIPGGILTPEIIRQAELTLGKIDRARSGLYTERACKDAERQSKLPLNLKLDAEYKKLHESRATHDNLNNDQLGHLIGRDYKRSKAEQKSIDNECKKLSKNIAKTIAEGLGNRGHYKADRKQK
jgi:hypothetical protein